MQEIESQAIQNYQENMAFFQEKIPKLYNRLLALDTVLNEGKYPQQYDLVYDNDYFDILELSSGAKLYNTNSINFSKNIADKISFVKGEQSFRSIRKINFENDALNIIKKTNSYTSYSNSAEIYDLYHNNIDDSMHMKEIDKFIFFGVGLGFHIKEMIEKFDFQIVLIIEDSLELFRLSLFTINYKDIFANRTAYMSISESSSLLRSNFSSFYMDAFFKDQYLKFHLFSSSYESKIDEIRSFLISRPEATYNHNRLLEKSRKVLERIEDGYKFLDLRKRKDDNYFKDKPWLVLGAGPSLYKNADWIVKNQNNFIIIAAFTALNTLKRIGVQPHIAVQMDENPYTTNEMIEKLGDLSFLDDTLLFFSASVSPELFQIFKKENIYLNEDRTKYKLSKSTVTISSVGDSIYASALIFNVANIYLLGLDFALTDDGHTHSADHFKARKLSEKKEDNDQNDFHLDDIIKIKGNFRDIVNSTPILSLSIPVINSFTRKYKTSKQTVYNLSDGCSLESTIPLQIENIKGLSKLDRTNIKKELVEYFDSLSTTNLDEKELQGLDCRKAQIKDYYSVLEEFKNAPHSNSEIFMQKFIKLTSYMCNHDCAFELREILLTYFISIAPYVDDFFNTKEISNTKKFTKKFNNILERNIRKVVETYDEDLHRLNK